MEEQDYKTLSEALLGLDSYITFNKTIAMLFGIESAIYLSTLIWKSQYYEKRNMLINGYFFSTQNDMKKNCILSPYKQSEACGILKDYGIIDVVKKGLPSKNHFKINHKKLFEIISNCKSQVNSLKMTSHLTLNDLSKNVKSYNNIKINNTSFNNSFSKEKEIRSDERPLSGCNSFKEPIRKLNRRTPEQIANSLSQSNPIQSLSKRQILSEGIKKLSQSPPIHIPNDYLSEEMKAVLNHWEGLGLKISSKTTKTHKEGLKKLRRLFGGQLLFDKKYTVEEINNAITRFSLAVKNKEYLPQDKKQLIGININDFIQNKYGKIKSYFQIYLSEYEPKPIQPILENKYPEIVNKLKKRFTYEILGNIRPSKFTPKEENDFIKASIRLIEYWKDNRSKITGEFNSSQKADLLFDSIKNSANGNLSMVTSGWFCSDVTFNTRLSAWLQQERITSAGADDGGEDRKHYKPLDYLYDEPELATSEKIIFQEESHDIFCDDEEESLANRLKRVKQERNISP